MRKFLSVILMCLALFTANSAQAAWPNAPTSVSATPVQGGIKVKWTPATAPAPMGVDIYRSRSPNSGFGKINTNGVVTGTAYTDLTVMPGVTYYYKVESVGSLTGTSAFTNTVNTVAPVPPPPPVAITVSPTAVSVQAGDTQQFLATVTNATDVTVSWTASCGLIGAATGAYLAPSVAETCLVTATANADATKSATATVTVTAPPPPPPVAIAVSPTFANLQAGAVQQFTATVTNATDTSVVWSVVEAACGTVSSTGLYTAPLTSNTCTVQAASVADSSKTANASAVVSAPPPPPPTGSDPTGILGPDRYTVWNPGLNAVGGIPVRNTICATVAPKGSGIDDVTSINTAITNCPAGQVVQLTAGVFTINSNFINITKGITLRGSGAAPGVNQTVLQKTNGAKPNSGNPGPSAGPVILVGNYRWAPSAYGATDVSINLASDAAKDALTVTLASAPNLHPGDIVLLDEKSGASWQPDPQGHNQVLESPDGRVMWQRHNPSQGQDDPVAYNSTTGAIGNGQDAASWFCRQDRPTNEMHEVLSVSGNTVTFTTPVHISYRVSHQAQIEFYAGAVFVKNAGIEDLKVLGGDDGNIRFHVANASWVKNVENTQWLGEGFAIDYSFRIEVRESYVHDGAWSQPGGGGYAISLMGGTSEDLIENNIILKANKMMVGRAAGTASVVGYNYADDGFINTIDGWQEVGINGSHMVGSHHILFEGNMSFNYDSDQTHGNAIYMTIFRNYLTGVRAPFVNTMDGKTINDSTQGNSPLRCGGLMAFSYWHSFVGNVMGVPGGMTGWIYDRTFTGANAQPGIWMLGWDGVVPYNTDARVAATTIRHGNYDYLTNSIHWDPTITPRSLPPSLYLTAKPAFFGNLAWPWVDPTGGSPLTTGLPAKIRLDSGQPLLK